MLSQHSSALLATLTPAQVQICMKISNKGLALMFTSFKRATTVIAFQAKNKIKNHISLPVGALVISDIS